MRGSHEAAVGQHDNDPIEQQGFVIPENSHCVASACSQQLSVYQTVRSLRACSAPGVHFWLHESVGASAVGAMSHRRKHVSQALGDSCPELQEGQRVLRVCGPRGSNILEV